MRIAFAVLSVLALIQVTDAVKRGSWKKSRGLKTPNSSPSKSSPKSRFTQPTAIKTPTQCFNLRQTKKVYACPTYNSATSVIQREKGGYGLKKKCEASGCCWFPFKDKSKRCYTSKNGYLTQRIKLKRKSRGKVSNMKFPDAKIPESEKTRISTTTATITKTEKLETLPSKSPKHLQTYTCKYDPLETKVPCVGGQKSKIVCESKNCCWHKKPLPGMRHRCLMATQIDSQISSQIDSQPSTHFPGSLDIQKTPAMTKRQDQEKCIAGINARMETDLKMCVDIVQNFEERENCDTSMIRAKNPMMSHCRACKKVGCCFDPKPKVKNGKIIPMCFNTTLAEIEIEKAEENLKSEKEAILAEQLQKLKHNINKADKIMGQGGHATAAPGTAQKTGSRHRDLLSQMYPGMKNPKSEATVISDEKNEEASNPNGYSSRINGLLAMLGGQSDKKDSMLSGLQPANSQSWKNKPVQADVMGTKTGGVKSDKLSALMGMMNGDTSKLDTIKQFLDVEKAPKAGIRGFQENPSIIVNNEDEDHSRPRFKNQMYAQAYHSQLQNMESKLSQSGQGSVYIENQMKFYKRAIDKMFKKYMVYDGKTDKSRVEIAQEMGLVSTTLAPVLTTKTVQNVNSDVFADSNSFSNIPVDQIAIVGTGDIPDDIAEIDTAAIPYIQKNHLIGNDEAGSCYPSTCGNPKKDNYNNFSFLKKIAGGNAAGSVEYWPWQVSLRRFYENDPLYSHICGATLIADNWVLSAAHCFKKHVVKFKPMGQMEDQADRYLAHMGRYSRESYEDSIQVRRIDRYVSHEKFNAAGSPVLYDIAVASFVLPVRVNDWVKPACLPAMDSHAEPGMKMWITGWGETKGDIGGNNAHLKELSLPVATDEECRNDWPNNWHEGWLCADTGLKEDACTGDSGGPAVQKMEDGRWRVIGVVSAGSEDCSTNKIKSAVFSSVVYFRQWIDRATGSLCLTRN